MIGDISVHGANNAEFIGVCGCFAEQVADHEPAFPAGSESPGRRIQGAGGPFGGEVSGGDFFTAASLQFGFVVERVDVRWSAIHEQVDHVPDSRRELWLSGGHGVQRFGGLGLLQKVGQCQSSEAHTAAFQHAASSEDDG